MFLNSYLSGTASVAKAFSNYLDVMMDYRMNRTLSKVLPMPYDFLAPYPDFLSLGIVLVLTGINIFYLTFPFFIIYSLYSS